MFLTNLNEHTLQHVCVFHVLDEDGEVFAFLLPCNLQQFLFRTPPPTTLLGGFFCGPENTPVPEAEEHTRFTLAARADQVRRPPRAAAPGAQDIHDPTGPVAPGTRKTGAVRSAVRSATATATGGSETRVGGCVRKRMRRGAFRKVI